MWQKESTKKNALYINLCVGNLNDVHDDLCAEISAHKNMKWLYEKSDAMSRKKRQTAKVFFEERNWQHAIEWYNEALCFAENGSTSLGIAFAHRSACFFNMKLYERCLIDIQLATQYNCPTRLIPELEKRKWRCQEYIANGMQSKDRPLHLDFVEDEHFPGMANVVAIKKSDNKCAAFARQNIDVGKIVVIDKGFTKALFTIYGWKCNICLESNTNMLPCQKCTTAMFCHTCVENNLHQHECGMKTSLYNNFNNHLMQELRTFFVAINLFTNANEMMHFVEESINSDEVPKSLKDDRSKYRAFLKLTKNTRESKDVQFPRIVYAVYKILLEIPKIRIMFDSKKHRRFLMHLVAQHAEINLLQSYVAVEDFQMNDENGKVEQRKLYSQVGIMLGYFAHSCSPNICPIDRNGDTIYVVVRPIQAGQQLFVSNRYFHWKDPTDLYKILRVFECKCERCIGLRPSEEEISTFSSDPDYQLIKDSNIRWKIDWIDDTRFDFLKAKCIELLNKYGTIIWCNELSIVILSYMSLLSAEIRGAVQSQDSLNNNAC